MLINTTDILNVIITLSLRNQKLFPGISFTNLCQDIETTLDFSYHPTWESRRDWKKFWSKASVEYIYKEKGYSIVDFQKKFSGKLFLIHPYIVKYLPEAQYEEFLHSDFYKEYPFSSHLSVLFGTDATSTIAARDLDVGRKYITSREKLLQFLTTHQYSEAVVQELGFFLMDYLGDTGPNTDVIDLVRTGGDDLLDVIIEKIKILYPNHTDESGMNHLIPENSEYANLFEESNDHAYTLKVYSGEASNLQDVIVSPLDPADVIKNAENILTDLISFTRKIGNVQYNNLFTEAQRKFKANTTLDTDLEKLLLGTADNKKLLSLAKDIDVLAGMASWNDIDISENSYTEYTVLSNKLAILILDCFCSSLST